LSREVVRRLWELFEAREWDQAGELLADDFVADWLQTGERIRGRENYIELNRNYPGDWSITVKRLVEEGDVVASEIVVTEPSTGTFHAAGFFELRDGKIARATEYWLDPPTAPPPAWRSQWVERL
jgi:ketosteroid isomerase-like protein